MRRARPIYGSFAELPGSGFKARAARAKAIAAQDAARRADPAAIAVAEARRTIREEDALRAVVAQAEQRVVDLQAKLAIAKRRAAQLSEMTYRTGVFSTDAPALRATVDELPHVIGRAEDELIAAQKALADHRARHAHHLAHQPEADPKKKKARQS